MDFIPENGWPATHTGKAWWFLFRGDDLLIVMNNTRAEVPVVKDPAQLGLAPVDTLYIGMLDTIPCFSGEVTDDENPPEGMSFIRLRKLIADIDEEIFPVAGRAFQIVNWARTHRYCSRCGSKTKRKEYELAMVCEKCGFATYPRISPAVITAVVKDNAILLARAHRFPPGLYSVIAGFVEPGETLEQCVKREILEETGIEVRNIRYFGSQQWPFPNSLMVGFTAEYESGEIEIDPGEIADARWFTHDSLPELPHKITIARRLIEWFLDEKWDGVS